MTTWAILASGPSLTPADVDAVRGRMPVLAIKDAIRLAPDADVLYGCDGKWWRHYGPTLPTATTILRYALQDPTDPARAPERFGATVLRNTGELGLETDPTGLRTGRNSGYQAVNLAVHLGATRILLLGYDMRKGPHGRQHWFTEPRPASYAEVHPPDKYERFLLCWPTIVAPLQALGIEVLNCTPGSALDVFPRATVAEALAPLVAA
jgi:hypothetical protein